MDEGNFWGLLDRARASAGSDLLRMHTTLHALLVRFPVEEVVAFQALLVKKVESLRTWPHIDAAASRCVDLDPEAFFWFSLWVCSQGKAVYERVLADPASVRNMPLDQAAFSHDAFMVARAVDRAAREMDVDTRSPAWPAYCEDFPFQLPAFPARDTH